MPASIIAPFIIEALGIAATGFAAALITFGVRLVTTFVISSILAQRSQPSGGGAGGSDMGNRVQLPPNTDNKIPVVYGTAYMKPVIIDAKISTDNQTMWYVIAFSEAMESDSIGTFSFGDILWADKKLNFDSTDKTKVISWTDSSGNTTDKVNGNLYVYLYRDGSSKSVAAGQPGYTTQTAWQILSDSSIAAAQRWDSTKKMSKLVFAIVKVIYKPEADLTGLAEITAEVKNTLSSPGLVIQDYLTNIRYGPALSTATINTTALTALDTYSSELISYTTTASTTATIARYAINGPVNTTKNFLDNVSGLVDCCDSWLQWDEVKNQWSVVINKEVSTASITTVTSDEIIGGINIQPVDLNSTFNSVAIQYANSKARDQTGHWVIDVDSFPNITRSPNEPDNQLSVDLPYTNNIIQAQYIAARRLLQSREDLTVNFTMNYSGIQINAGDVIGILHDRYGWDALTFGSQGKLFRVNQVQEAVDQNSNLYAKISASEYNPTIYTDSLDGLQDFELSLNTGISDPGVVGTPGTPSISNANTTTSVPSFDVTSVVPSTGAVIGMEYWYGTTTTIDLANWQRYSTEIPNTTFFNTGTAVTSHITGLPAGSYYFATRATTSRTKSAFSSISSQLVWNPLPSSGSSNTSTYSSTATDAKNILHNPLQIVPIDYPIAISTSSNYAPVGNTSTFTYNPGTTTLTAPKLSSNNVATSGLSVSTGSVVTKTLSAGGFPLNSAGTATIFPLLGSSSALVVSNYSGNLTASIFQRGYGQNRPGGTASTAPSPSITMEGAFGTPASPTAYTANQTLGGMTAQGYDGLNWPSDLGQAYNFAGWFSTEAMTNNGSTTTYQAGSGYNIFVQPAWTRPGINTTRQRPIFMNWTTASGGPSTLNLNMGSGVTSNASDWPTMTMVDGTTYTGYGRTNLNFINAATAIIGVPSQDTAPDNATLTTTNLLTFISQRRSAVAGRRNQILSGDNVGGITVRVQTTSSQSGIGSQVGYATFTALENMTASTLGSQYQIATANTGTTTISNRVALNDRQNTYTSDNHVFNKTSGATVRIGNLSTSSSIINSDLLTINGFNNGTFPAIAYFNTATVQFVVPVQFPVYTRAVANGLAGVVGSQICISDSAGSLSQSTDGMMAFWDTTNNRWSYIHDNNAV